MLLVTPPRSQPSATYVSRLSLSLPKVVPSTECLALSSTGRVYVFPQDLTLAQAAPGSFISIRRLYVQLKS